VFRFLFFLSCYIYWRIVETGHRNLLLVLIFYRLSAKKKYVKNANKKSDIGVKQVSKRVIAILHLES